MVGCTNISISSNKKQQIITTSFEKCSTENMQTGTRLYKLMGHIFKLTTNAEGSTGSQGCTPGHRSCFLKCKLENGGFMTGIYAGRSTSLHLDDTNIVMIHHFEGMAEEYLPFLTRCSLAMNRTLQMKIGDLMYCKK